MGLMFLFVFFGLEVPTFRVLFGLSEPMVSDSLLLDSAPAGLGKLTCRLDLSEFISDFLLTGVTIGDLVFLGLAEPTIIGFLITM